jgi:hypothetical protein
MNRRTFIKHLGLVSGAAAMPLGLMARDANDYTPIQRPMFASWKDCVRQVDISHVTGVEFVHGRGPNFDPNSPVSQQEAYRACTEAMDQLLNMSIRMNVVGSFGSDIPARLQLGSRSGNVIDDIPLRFDSFYKDDLPVFYEPLLAISDTGGGGCMVNQLWENAKFQIEAYIPEQFDYAYKFDRAMWDERYAPHEHYVFTRCSDGVICPQGTQVWYIER